MFSSNQNTFGDRKDTVKNVEATGKFVWNLATWDLREAVNASAEQVSSYVDEFQVTELEKEFSKVLEGVPMVAASPVKFECEYHTTLRLPGNPPMGTVDIIIAKVVAVHIADDALTNGRLDIQKTRPIARCGYYEYTVVRDIFEMIIPGENKAVLDGLEGRTTKAPSKAPSKC